MLQVQQGLQAQQEGTVPHYDEAQWDSIPEQDLREYLFDYENWAYHTDGGKRVNCMADYDAFVPWQEVVGVHRPSKEL